MANGETVTEKCQQDQIYCSRRPNSSSRPLTNNPNVGGFGQAETEIVLKPCVFKV
jgi:apocytochrome f